MSHGLIGKIVKNPCISHCEKENDSNRCGKQLGINQSINQSINGEQHQIELENCNAGLCEKLEENSYMTLTLMGRYRL
jgi:hypothetical protein